MHLLDCYALNCGLKINKPFIFEKFFPLDVEKYITFSPEGDFQSRRYDFWQEAIRIMSPYLRHHNINIVQLGSVDSVLYEGCINLCGQTTDSQSFYIINNSLLHLSVDSFSNHLASHAGKKIVSLFSDSDPKNNGPYFSKDEDLRLLSPDLAELGRSYSMEEDPKTINQIKPEEIAKNVCELLDLDFDFNYRNIYIGEDFHMRRVEYIPSEVSLDISHLSIDSLVVRMDLKFDEQSLINQLNASPCSIITRNPINIDLLNHFKRRVTQFVYVLTEESSVDYVQDLFDTGIECLLMDDGSDEEVLNDYKFKFLDYGQIHDRNFKKKEDLTFLEGLDLKHLYYRSNKYVIADNNIFYGEASYLDDQRLEMLGDKTLKRVIDNDAFWKESENYIFYYDEEEFDS